MQNQQRKPTHNARSEQQADKLIVAKTGGMLHPAAQFDGIPPIRFGGYAIAEGKALHIVEKMVDHELVFADTGIGGVILTIRVTLLEQALPPPINAGTADSNKTRSQRENANADQYVTDAQQPPERRVNRNYLKCSYNKIRSCRSNKNYKVRKNKINFF